MPIDPLKVTLAVKQGVSVVCSMCENYWSAYDKGAVDCGQTCGGPMSGGMFDKYRGPVTDFSSICFVCGEKPTHVIKAGNNVRSLGCCQIHVDFVKTFVPTNKTPVNVILKGKDGEISTEEMAGRPQRIRLKLI